MSQLFEYSANVPENGGEIARRDVIKSAGVGFLAALASAGIISASAKASAQQTVASPDNSKLFAPLVGSWILQVEFTAGPNTGKIEQTLACFNVGGIMTESDGVSPYAHFGNWSHSSNNLYEYTLVELYYDSTTNNVAQVVVPQINFMLTSSDSLSSTATTTTVYIYNPATGQMVNKLVIPGVSKVTGQRLTSNWVAPAQFPIHS